MHHTEPHQLARGVAVNPVLGLNLDAQVVGDSRAHQEPTVGQPADLAPLPPRLVGEIRLRVARRDRRPETSAPKPDGDKHPLMAGTGFSL